MPGAAARREPSFDAGPDRLREADPSGAAAPTPVPAPTGVLIEWVRPTRLLALLSGLLALALLLLSLGLARRARSSP